MFAFLQTQRARFGIWFSLLLVLAAYGLGVFVRLMLPRIGVDCGCGSPWAFYIAFGVLALSVLIANRTLKALYTFVGTLIAIGILTGSWFALLTFIPLSVLWGTKLVLGIVTLAGLALFSWLCDLSLRAAR